MPHVVGLHATVCAPLVCLWRLAASPRFGVEVVPALSSPLSPAWMSQWSCRRSRRWHFARMALELVADYCVQQPLVRHEAV